MWRKPLATAAEMRRFQTEAEAAAKLHHANIVAIHEVGEHNGQPYIAMEYVPKSRVTSMLRFSRARMLMGTLVLFLVMRPAAIR